MTQHNNPGIKPEENVAYVLLKKDSTQGRIYLGHGGVELAPVPVGVPSASKRWPDGMLANHMRMKLRDPEAWIVQSFIELPEDRADRELRYLLQKAAA